MPVFLPHQTVVTMEPRVVVDPGLQPGRYLFQLVVCNEAGDRSLSSEWIVTIQEPPQEARLAPAPNPLWLRLKRRLRPFR